LIFGITTLIVASFAAIMEQDGKKIVALSTLRQLGLMFISLSLGGKFICLIHVLMHAFAKANLFLNVGRILHFRFSQQDSRFISSGEEELSLFFSTIIRVASLSGIAFFSGFFSKELVLLSEFSLISSIMLSVLFIGVVSMTLSYCIVLLGLFSIKTLSFLVLGVYKSFNYKIAIFFATLGVIFRGFFYNYNTYCYFIFSSSINGYYWRLLIARFIFVSLNSSLWLSLFLNQKKLTRMFSNVFVNIVKGVDYFFSSLLEPFYLVLALRRSMIFLQLTRLLVLVFFVSVLLLFL
jgi:NADH-ubiquinone oxidoreductase chain 5